MEERTVQHAGTVDELTLQGKESCSPRKFINYQFEAKI